jgi:tRNA A-37 threonylcarbamoyl transferase component Bud32
MSQEYLPLFHGCTFNLPTKLWVSDSRVLPYCPNADFYLWLKPVASWLPVLALLTVGICITGATFGWLHYLFIFLGKAFLEPFKPLLIQSPGGSLASVLAVLNYISWVFYSIMGVAVSYLTIAAADKPTHIALTGNTISLLRRLPDQRFVYPIPEVPALDFAADVAGTTYLMNENDKGGFHYFPSKILFWDDIFAVSVERPKGKRSVRDYRLCLTARDGYQMRIRYGDILSSEDRERLVNTLRSFFPDFLDDELIEVFSPPPERQSYTELWLRELSAAPKRDKLTPLQPGNLLQEGKYCVDSKIGVGGQGTVYLAHCRNKRDNLDDLVVLKEFILPVYPDSRVRKKAAEKFQEEAAMLAKLQHPQIVRFLDLFVEDHRAYLVLERAEGTTLKDLVAAEGPQNEAYAIELSIKLCGILSYLHAQSPPVIHRDFTPDNLILGQDGIVRLIDFSVAQQVKSNLTGSVVGKPNYLAPEQFRGKPTTASDIYSLGATMYYLLTGQDPSPISVSRPKDQQDHTSRCLDDLVARSTQLEIDRRYQSVAALLEDLTRLQNSSSS